MRKVLSIFVLCILFALGAAAADTVYVDGTGNTADAYTDFAKALAALPNGGTVIVTGDTEIGTRSGSTVSGLTVSAKGGKITVKGTEGARLIFLRSMTVNSEFEFDDIHIHSTATASGNFVANGNAITMGAGVVTSAASGAMYPAIFGGAGSGTVTYDTHVTVYGGTWRSLWGGNYGGTFNGTSTLIIGGAVCNGTLSAQNYQGTYKGASSLIVDLRGNKTVTADTYKQTPTVLVDDGYRAVLDGNTYSQERIPEAPTTVYVDGTGKTEGAYTTLEAGIAALHENGGTVILTGDTEVGTKDKAATLPAKSGKVTVTSDNGSKMIVMRTVYFNCDMEFTNMVFHSGATAMGNVLANGHALTIAEDVTVSKDDGAILLALFGGAGSGTVNYDTELNVYTGTWRAIYGASYTGTFTGHSALTVRGATSTGTISAKNFEGTHTGTYDLTFDLRGGKTVSAKTFKQIPTLLTDAGYEGVLMNDTYTQRKITEEAPKTVYVDGTGKTEGAYTSLAAAVADMQAGGTVIVCGDTEIAEATTLPQTGSLLITSKYGDEDYTETASLQFKADLTLGAETVFKDVTLERTKLADGNLFIVAAGNPLTVDTGVVCLNYTGKQFLSLVGGYYNTDYKGDSHITVKSGFFRNLYGGNQYGTFTGNSYVDVTGGSFDNAVVGGSFNGNFNGDVHLNFAGSASLVYGTSTQGIVGGILGDGGNTAVTFTGNIYMYFGGKCGINHNVIGASRNKNTHTVGNVEITIAEDAYAFYSVYAGGYTSGLDGSTKIIVNGGDFNGSLFGGSHSGTVAGDTCIEINGGKLCYYRTNIFSSMSDIAGTKNVYGGGESGSMVNGKATVVMNGGSVYGNIYGGTFEGAGTVKGISSVTLTNGLVFGMVSADNARIDLSEGGSVELGVSTTVKSLIGGGELILAPAAKLIAGTLTGTAALSIHGLPLPTEYVKANEVADGASFTYKAQDGETLLSDGGSYSIGFEGACQTTEVTVQHKEGFTILVRAGRLSSTTPLTADSTTETTATYTLTPGLYNVTAFATDNRANYKRKVLYVDGRSETYTLLLEFDAQDPDGFDYKTGYFFHDEFVEKYYKETDVADYKQPDTPYFNERYGISSVYTTNDELVAFVNEKAAACDYMYVYSIATSNYGYDVPLALFTMDAIPEGATLAEAAAIVRKTADRDILMINGGTHGNEPSGTEGTLAYISELCGEYGRSVLTDTNIGAIIVTPRLNPDGAKDWIREIPTPNQADIDNLNRDYMALTSPEAAGLVRAYNLFMPTFMLDCHEALANPLWSDGQFTTDIYDVGIHAPGNLNSPYGMLPVIRGDRSAGTIDSERLGMEILAELRTKGLRTYYYETITRMVCHTNYFGLGGTYAFLQEIPGITGGEGNMARRTHAQVTGIKTFVDKVVEMDGEMARIVKDARASMASSQIYDGEKPVVLDSARSRAELRRFEWNNPLVAADTTVRVQDNLTYMYDFDTAIRYRTLPTAYVFPADTENVAKILALLDKHSIAYKQLEAGTAMTLQQYSGSKNAATLGAEAEFTFANGAYLVPVDGVTTYITALLFEPDNPDSEGFYCSLAQMELLAVADTYRSTKSYIAAKHGISGSFYAIEAGDKKIASVTADGMTATTVTDGDYTILPTPKSSLTVTYTDGTGKTVYFGDIPGDMNGDGSLSVADVLLLLRAVLNDMPAADLNGDGKTSLLDVVRLIKQIA